MLLSPVRRLSVLVVVAGLTVALCACSSSSNGSAKNGAPGATIAIANFKFSAVTVAAGATVTVSNNDPTTHTVSADNGSFSVKVPGGKSATFVAPSTPGTYKFHCMIHSTMHGVLTVT
jgi:plastocyanin